MRWFKGVPSPVKHPEKVDMVIFRENTEDVYAGMELEQGTPEVARLIDFCASEFGWDIRPDSGIGLKPVSRPAPSAWSGPPSSTRCARAGSR